MLAASSKQILLSRSIRNPTRARDFSLPLVVVVVVHLVIGLRTRHRFIRKPAKSRSAPRRRQRRLRRVHGFCQRGPLVRLRRREHAEGIAVHIRNANVVGYHRSVVRDRQPRQFHGTGYFYSRRPGCAPIGRGHETHFQLAGVLCPHRSRSRNTLPTGRCWNCSSTPDSSNKQSSCVRCFPMSPDQRRCPAGSDPPCWSWDQSEFASPHSTSCHPKTSSSRYRFLCSPCETGNPTTPRKPYPLRRSRPMAG